MDLRTELGPEVRSVEAIRQIAGVPRPASMRAILDRYRDPIIFDEPLNTPDGVALGGHHRITLERDGRVHHAGHMRATGLPSFTYAVRSVLANDAGVPVVAGANGRVHGTSEVGDRESRWDQREVMPLVAWHWAEMKRARINTSLVRDADFFGTFGSVLTFVGEIAAGGVLAGPVGACIMIGVQAADAAGLDEHVGVGGLVGVVVTGGVLVVFGPTAIVPAVVAGAAAGVVVELAVESRPMEQDERDFATAVFGPTLPFDRIRLTNMLGLNGRAFTMPSVGDTILVNIGEGLTRPTEYRGHGDPTKKHDQSPGQLLVHELVHAWQIDHSAFLPGLICKAIGGQLTTLGGNMRVYRYGEPGRNFSEFNTEQQASIVEEWFAGSPRTGGGGRPDRFDPGLTMERAGKAEQNPYFRYIRDNIRKRIP